MRDERRRSQREIECSTSHMTASLQSVAFDSSFTALAFRGLGLLA